MTKAYIVRYTGGYTSNVRYAGGYTSNPFLDFTSALEHARKEAKGCPGVTFTVYSSEASVTVKTSEPVYETVIDYAAGPTCTSPRGDR